MVCLTAIKLSIVGAGHAAMKALQSSPKCRGRGPLLRCHCLINLMAVMLRLSIQAIIPASIPQPYPPSFFNARSNLSFHGTAQLSRIKLPYYFWVAENSGPGAM
ncbi:hypothetical protein B0F88_11169 [Methylobacter tundripaludum]|uniref:Uncharacterized protein n=1 Tax=Methylobacter tundripaludum TaxID=173365 RepID=A0A2S6GU60_9GAMM|nr:hypothetical protein B0F88_11169 [Methylobacter tundripaludum]